MFYGCSSLNEIKIAYTGNFSGDGVPSNAFNYWVYQVASTVTFNYDGTDTTTGASAIPTGWTVLKSYPTITARASNVVVSSTRYGSPSARDLEYSVDNGSTWNTFTLGSTSVTLANVGDKMLLRGNNTTIANTWQNYWRLAFSDYVDVSGDLWYLLQDENQRTTLTGDQPTFYGLFENANKLVDASGLILHWTTINVNAAFEAMFRNCTSLVVGPEFPATTIASWTCKDTFKGCSSLTQAPELPATTLGECCYEAMFQNCTSLNEIKIGWTGNFSGTGVPNNAFLDWVDGVAASGTLYYNGSDTATGASAIPTGWSVQTF